VVGRLRSGAWPETAAVRFHGELSAALRLYRRHPFLNTAPREGARVRAFGKAASFNALGYRSPERPAAKPAGMVRVVCSGGSTTFDLLAADNAGSWPARLEERLRQVEPGVEVWNAGFPGWTTLENVISLVVRDEDLRPDLCVLFQGVNDLQPASHLPFDRQYEHGHAELAAAALGFDLAPPPWHRRLLLLEAVRRAVRGPEDPWAQLAPADLGGGRRVRLPEEAVAVFARNLRSYCALARAVGARPVLVTQTIRLRALHLDGDRSYLGRWIPGLEPEAAAGELERLNQVLRAVAQEGSGPLLLVDAARDVGWEDSDFADPLHFAPRGSERLAALLAERLTPVVADQGRRAFQP
jgi:lysophospholipase L1-like esterase